MLGLFNRKSKEKTVPQRLRDKEDVSIEEISDYIHQTFPKEEAQKFFKDVRLSVFPTVVERLIHFKDEGSLTEADFMQHLRRLTKEQLED